MFFFILFAEEEIDVVSVGDKNLPTNPSAKDRRALQNTVANKITARIVKTASGSIRTITPRRRSSDASSDSSTYGVTPSKQHSSSASYISYNDSIPTASLGTTISRQSSTQSLQQGSRKRANPAATSTPSGTKRFKSSKKSQQGGNTTIASGQQSPNAASSAGSRSKRSSDNEETESVEKRNLHNNMERQRRIGLKNLFENLKDKIPTLREKERAPKVNILREATMLCSKLTREDAEYEALKRRQSRLVQRLKQMRQSAAAARSNNLNVS